LAISATQKSPTQKLIITVKEARKILGTDANKLSDNQIEDQITLLSSLADTFLQNIGSKVE
jgi:hypothetical protein